MKNSLSDSDLSLKRVLTYSALLLLPFLFTNEINGQSYEVGHRSITFQDSTRGDRDVETHIYYPADSAGDNVPIANDSFPVIVFGHGFSMNWDAYPNLWNNFVPKGYIMAFPNTETGFSPDHATFARDLDFISNTMKAEGRDSNSVFYRHVVPRTALMGHSMGGGASFLAAANNDSITTLVGLAPADTDPSSIDTAKDVKVSTMILSGEEDDVTPPEEHHIPHYDTLNVPCKTFVNILGGAHCYFAMSGTTCDIGGGGGSISREEQQQITYDYVGLWLDYKLKENCDAFPELQDSLNTSTRVDHRQACFGVTSIDSVSTTKASCDTPDGSLTIHASGGPETGMYSIDNGANYKKDSVFTGLSPGPYEVIYMDGNECADTAQVMVTSKPGPPIDSVVTGTATCGDSTGSVAIQASMTGATPYQYSIDSGQSYRGDSIFVDLVAGEYAVTVKDANGCRTDTSVTIDNKPGPTIDSVSTTSSYCDSAEGRILIHASGGSGELSYSNDSGDSYQPDSTFEGLPPEPYRLVVRDSNGCRADTTVKVENRSLHIDSVSKSAPSCDTADGEMVIHASGKAAPFRYSTDSGNTFEPDSHFTGLSAGVYSIVVEDSNGCQRFETTTLSAPKAPSIDSMTVGKADCGMENGLIDVHASGGSGGLVYSVDSGNTFQGSSTFTDAAPGEHVVVVADTLGCFDTTQVTVGIHMKPVAKAQADADTIDLALDSTINFTAQGSQGSSHIWDFGDGDSAFTAAASHAYGSVGTYTVILAVVEGECIERDTLTIEVMKSTGRKRLQKKGPKTLRVYPNPTNGAFTITIKGNKEPGTILVKDISGRILRKKEIRQPSRLKFSAASLENGIYLIEWVSGQGTKTIKRLIVTGP